MTDPAVSDQRILPRRLRFGRFVGPLAGLVGIFVLFTILLAVARGLSFADPANLETLLRQTTIVATAALGMTAVIVAGGIDLSVGAVIALVTVVVAAALRAGAPPLVAALAGVGTGLAAGLVNGALVTRLRVVPFIVTLGTMLLIRGAAKGIAHEQKIDAPPSWLDDLLARTGDGHRWMLLPAGVWLLAAARARDRGAAVAHAARALLLRGRVQRRGGAAQRRAGRAREAAGLRARAASPPGSRASCSSRGSPRATPRARRGWSWT